MPLHRPIFAAKRFAKCWKTLPVTQRERIIEILLALPDIFQNPHQHTGFGLRRLHGTQFYEIRLDLRWRLILSSSNEEIILFDVMNLDQVRRL